MSRITPDWPLLHAVAATMACSFFVQAGGAVFAIVLLVRCRMAGQIASMKGAYSNDGEIMFLTEISYIDPATCFMVIACAAVITLLAIMFLDKPRGLSVELKPDGSGQMIDVS